MQSETSMRRGYLYLTASRWNGELSIRLYVFLST